ncbi:hypothetical protein [Rhizobium ruizarguesonis]|nr:hypothetical protein [Rhizobium ruizarguesonis]
MHTHVRRIVCLMARQFCRATTIPRTSAEIANDTASRMKKDLYQSGAIS